MCTRRAGRGVVNSWMSTTMATRISTLPAGILPRHLNSPPRKTCEVSFGARSCVRRVDLIPTSSIPRGGMIALCGASGIAALEFENVDGVTIPRVNSISGHERNKLFINHGGQDFEDVSLWSGGDSIADGRCFAIWDYDHDGGQDLALINMNSPHLQILRNQIPDRAERTNGFIAIRLIGGNHDSKPSSQWSNRNGNGAQLSLPWVIAVHHEALWRRI